MTDRDRAVRLLMHYLRLAGFKPGHQGDFRSEMEELVESIMDATIERLDARARERAAPADLGSPPEGWDRT